jgi:hypothetical protein
MKGIGATFFDHIVAFLISSIARLRFEPAPLTWTSCDELDLGVDQQDLLFPIQCAQLAVPLDYSDPSNTETTEVQLLKVTSPTAPARGTIIINPGGPGESGCDYLALRASRFHA